MIVIRGGTVSDGASLREADVLVSDDQVAEVGTFEAPAGAVVIDASGCVVGPAFVDLHVHFRDPGQTWKEDIASGSQAAAAGGFSAVVVMPNTEPAIDTPKIVELVKSTARAEAITTVEVAGALTRSREGVEASDLEGMYGAGVRLFSDDGDSVADEALLRRIMEHLATLPGAVVSEHAEDTVRTTDGHMHDGDIASRHEVGGLPREAEDEVVARDISLTEETGCPLHVQHLSTAGSVELVRSARARGAKVTAEVTPHHLVLDHTSLEVLDPDLKMYPPLREPADRKALVDGLQTGVIDAVATDHAPHAEEEKAVAFEDAPRGVIGLETAAPIALDALDGDVTLLFERMSRAPARIGRLQRHGRPVRSGEPANLVVFDPNVEWVPDTFRSKASNSPFRGRRLRGQVRATVHEGAIVYDREIS